MGGVPNPAAMNVFCVNGDACCKVFCSYACLTGSIANFGTGILIE
jgi:hypothetical protein